MNWLLFLLATIASLAIIKIHERVFKQALNKRYMLVVALLLGYAIAYGGSKGGGEEPPPEPPPPPDEPDEPYEPVEGVRIRLIGKTIDGKFVPLTSEWIQADGTNIVEIIEQATEVLDNE